MKAALVGRVQRAVAAAATLTGGRFGLLVGSSLVATAAIVAVAMTSANGNGPLAELVGRSLAANRAPVAGAPAPSAEPSAAPSGGEGPASLAPSPAAPPPAAAPSPAPQDDPPAEPPPKPTAPTPSAPEPGPIQHVFLISLASSGYEAAFGSAPQMPYLATTLRPQGLLLSGYSLLDRAALPNSIAAVSGQPPNPQTVADCPTYTEFPAGAKANARGIVGGSGCVYPVETLTFADQMVGARLKWHAYMEGMADATGQPDSCVQPEPGAAEVPVPGGYSARLNPFVHFHSLLDLGDCAENDVPLSELERDLRKAETTPNFSYISPNLCNAGISGQCPSGAPDGAAAADAFLATLVPKILASPAYRKDGLLVVSFGQLNPGAPVDPAAANPLGVGALALSRLLAPGATDTLSYNPYSLLRTLEDLFGLAALGGAAGSKVGSLAPTLVGGKGETATGD